MSISLLMPVLNEEENLEEAVGRAAAQLERLAQDWELLILDDGSTDRTGEIADRLASGRERVRALHNGRNLNYGLTLQRGIREARCQWIVHDGADLPLAPEDFPKFIALFDQSDVIVARRVRLPGYTAWRVVTSTVYKRLIHTLFRSRIDDMTFTQFFRREFAQSIRFVTDAPATVTPELILRAEHTGRRVSEVVADFQLRRAGRPHFGTLKDISWAFANLLRLRWHTWRHGWES